MERTPQLTGFWRRDIWWLVTAGLVVYALSSSVGRSLVAGFVLIALAAGAYLLPTIIAGCRRHPSAGAIALLDILLGWTVLFWIIALVWAFSATYRDVRIVGE